MIKLLTLVFNYSFLLIFYTLLLILYFYIYNNSIKEYICTWSRNKTYLKRNYKDDYKAKLIFTFLRNFNLRYLLLDGSLLGAYRNGGFIPGDFDFDIGIPIWLNSNIFNCKEKINIDILEYGYKCVVFPKYYKVCNKTKANYYKMFSDYIKTNVKEIKYRLDASSNVIKLYFKGFYVDLWLMIGDESSSRVNNICNCLFSGIYTYGLEDAASSLISLYGFNFFKPMPKSKLGYKLIFQLPIIKLS